MFRSTKIRHYVGFMKGRGFDASAVLEGSGIDPAQLKSTAHLVDFAQYQTVVANMIRLSGEQGIGLDVGAATELTDLGIVGHAMMSSGTARDAVELWIRYSNALVGMLLTMHLDEQDSGRWSLTISEIRPTGFLFNFAADELLVLAVRLGSALTRTSIRPASLELSYPAPAHYATYSTYLHCKPRFNCRQTRIQFDVPPLSSALEGSDEEFNAICLQHCNQILQHITNGTSLSARVRSLLLSRMRGLPALEELAAELGMSGRTLRRRLHHEGLTYKQLIQEFRFGLAKEYVGHSHLTAKETAYLLGFKDTNAFRRAFKTWTGCTVHEFHERNSREMP